MVRSTLGQVSLGQFDFGSGQIGPEKSMFERTILRKGQRARKAKKIRKTKIKISQNRRNSSLKRNLKKIISVQVEKF